MCMVESQLPPPTNLPVAWLTNYTNTSQVWHTVDERGVRPDQRLEAGSARQDVHPEPSVSVLQGVVLRRHQRRGGRAAVRPQHLGPPPLGCPGRQQTWEETPQELWGQFTWGPGAILTCLHNVLVFDLHLLPRSLVAAVWRTEEERRTWEINPVSLWSPGITIRIHHKQ